jgi:hypothetical protein
MKKNIFFKKFQFLKFKKKIFLKKVFSPKISTDFPKFTKMDIFWCADSEYILDVANGPILAKKDRKTLFWKIPKTW